MQKRLSPEQKHKLFLEQCQKLAEQVQDEHLTTIVEEHGEEKKEALEQAYFKVSMPITIPTKVKEDENMSDSDGDDNPYDYHIDILEEMINKLVEQQQFMVFLKEKSMRSSWTEMYDKEIDANTNSQYL
jgi:coenzyme F420-reducing hydrogenase alpha subunit